MKTIMGILLATSVAMSSGAFAQGYNGGNITQVNGTGQGIKNNSQPVRTQNPSNKPKTNKPGNGGSKPVSTGPRSNSNSKSNSQSNSNAQSGSISNSNSDSNANSDSNSNASATGGDSSSYSRQGQGQGQSSNVDNTTMSQQNSSNSNGANRVSNVDRSSVNVTDRSSTIVQGDLDVTDAWSTAPCVKVSSFGFNILNGSAVASQMRVDRTDMNCLTNLRVGMMAEIAGRDAALLYLAQTDPAACAVAEAQGLIVCQRSNRSNVLGQSVAPKHNIASRAEVEVNSSPTTAPTASKRAAPAGEVNTVCYNEGRRVVTNWVNKMGCARYLGLK